MGIFLLTLGQVAVLLAFIFIGYFFRKKEIINEGGKKVLAKLLTCLFAPCYSVISLSAIVNVNDIKKYGVLLITGIGLALFAVLIAIPIAKSFSKDKQHQNILKYAFAFGNIGYFGYPLVNAVFGAETRALMMLFCLPMSVAIYTYGYYVLTTNPFDTENTSSRPLKQKLSFLWSPPMIGVYAGVILGLLSSGCSFTLPSVVMDALTVAGNCQSAPAMLLTGAVLASVPFKKLFTSISSYLIGGIRLLALPVITGLIFFIINLFGVSGELFVLVFRLSIIVSAMPVGMNVVVYPEYAGQDSTEGAKCCFISYVMALGALPLVFFLMETIAPLFI